MNHVLLAAVIAAAGPEQRPEPVVLRAEVAAPQEQAWRAFTTAEGVRTFFAEQALVEPRIGGAYEMYFMLANPPGERGSEGVRILAIEPPSRFLISWNAPSSFGPLRPQQTVVEVEFEPLGPSSTAVTLTHSGWGRGPAWQAVRDYFASAWPMVLGRLQYRFESGPVNWRRPPDGAALFRAAPADR